MSEHSLTAFQREECEHLLTVAQEALDNEETTDLPWGSLEGRTLTVTDWRGARLDLHWRADWHESEAPEHGSNGTSAARSLARLADLIYDAREPEPEGASA